MASGRKRLILTGAVVVFVVAAVVYGLAGPVFSGVTGSLGNKRPDVIRIDVLKAYGALKRPVPVFLHDAHTEAVSRAGKDCAACHLPLPGGKGLSAKFSRLEDKGRNQVMGVYHDKCIACHKETARKGSKSGPVTCGKCHADRPSAALARLPMDFGKSLHFTHTQKTKDKCELCHHVYDAKAQKTVYAKGKEGSCRYCHDEKKADRKKAYSGDNPRAYSEAAHASCILCHQTTAKSGVKAGPVNCAGCHGEKERKAMKRMPSPPRYARSQPDAALLAAAQAPGDTAKARMDPVPFLHKEHEAANESCKACHHADLSACVKCHTVPGSKDGKFVNLEAAMHDPSSKKTCIGCHNDNQKAKSCVGCHARLPKSPDKETGCATCHKEAPATYASPAERAAAARKMAEARKRFTGTYADADIPEKVTIKTMSAQYGPSEMPHRRMVRALEKGMKASRLSTAFHVGEGSLCQGCHHQSPQSKTPPRCSSCHANIPGEDRDGKPGLVAAYHGQCLGCHKDMGVKGATGCTDCHKEMKK